MKFILKSSACIEYFDQVVFMSDAWAGHQQYNLCIFGDQQYEDPQGPGTMHVPEIRYRPGNSGTVEAYETLNLAVAFTVWTSTSLLLARLHPWKGKGLGIGVE